MIANATVLHLPSGFMPVDARASLSKATTLDSLIPDAGCPYVVDEKAEPEKSFLAILQTLANLLIFEMRVLRLVKRECVNLEGLV